MAKTSTKYPAHAFPNVQAFRSEKRQQLRVLKKAAEAMRMGCAYLPDGGEGLKLIEDRIAVMLDQLSVKQWGR